MKKLLLILTIFLTSGICFAQDPKPTTNLVTLPTYSFSYHTSDSTVWMYKGSTHQWTKLFRTWYSKSAGNVITAIHASDTLNFAVYKLVADSVLAAGYFTNWKSQQYRKLNNHDSLFSLDERSHGSLTNINGSGSYHVSLSQKDSILSAVQHADTIRSAGYVTNFRLIQSLPTGYELEVITAGLTMMALPFTLSNRTMVFYNGAILSKALWSGVGTQTITLMIDTKQKDLLKIQNQ